MEGSWVARAYNEMQEGNYLKSLHLYRQISIMLGNKFFNYNVEKCKKYLLSSNLSSQDFVQKLKIASISDTFTYETFSPEAIFLHLTPNSAIQSLEKFQPDMLFVESAWHGKNNEWKFKISNPQDELLRIIEWCNKKCVPTIFWNKEDPVHFKTFSKVAEKCDYVFTTDIDCIKQYKKLLGHNRVYLLPFCVQAKLHNPIEKYARKNAICFAGSYYHKYEERCKTMDDYTQNLSEILEIEIFDRNFNNKSYSYQFPDKYKKFIKGTLPYSEIDKAYKGYYYALNMNTITNSCSMFSRRIFELLASNTTTISNYAYGMKLLFGDLVFSSESGKNLKEKLKNINEAKLVKLRVMALRKVMLEHTASHRINYIIDKVFSLQFPNSLPPILCLSKVENQEDINWITNLFEAQTYVNKYLLLVCDEKLAQELPVRTDTNIFITTYESRFLKDKVENFHWFAYLSTNDYYGKNYLLDLALTTQYTDASVVAKPKTEIINNKLVLLDNDIPYTFQNSIKLSSALFAKSYLYENSSISDIFHEDILTNKNKVFFLIDSLNYYSNARFISDIQEVKEVVDDLEINTGIHIDELLSNAENITVDTTNTNLPNAIIPLYNAPLILTSRYASYNNLYEYMFVHSRVKQYKQNSLNVNVFKLLQEDIPQYEEFEDIDIMSGNENILQSLLQSGKCTSVLIHLLKPNMWNVLKKFTEINIIIWVHGAEIQPWHRRAYNYNTDEELDKAKKRSVELMKFWHSVLKPMPKNLHLVFVSKHFAEEVMQDLGFRIPEEQYSIIHNPINTDLFSYEEKKIEQRKKILSIRPFASAKYANDLTVQAIEILSKKSFFNDLEFKILGDGELFDTILDPIKDFKNVIIERKFLSQKEIGSLHKEYGLFLNPTRWDSQGVSRDEAMSSGLVPITNAVAAVPEFVDESCGFLAPDENAQSLADAIEYLYYNPDKFLKLSKNASKRVRRQSSHKIITPKELAVIASHRSVK